MSGSAGDGHELADGSKTVVREALGLLIGGLIGSGCYRDVYDLPWSPQYVLKIETGASSFQNALEWEVWREMKDSKWSGYFAPCEAISACGTALLMWRTKPIKSFTKDLHIPSFFQDVKPENFGLLKGRIVCHDYGISELIRQNVKGTRLVLADGAQAAGNRRIVKAVAQALAGAS